MVDSVQVWEENADVYSEIMLNILYLDIFFLGMLLCSLQVLVTLHAFVGRAVMSYCENCLSYGYLEKGLE